MALVKLTKGVAVNPDTFKYLTVEPKQASGKVIYAVVLKIDDNSEHWLKTFDDRDDAIAEVKSYARALNEAEF